jgi:hypothetical protein
MKPKSEQLREIRDQMLDLLRQAKDLLPRGENRIVRERAEAYWYGTIQGALTNDGDYLPSTMTTLDDTIEEIRNLENDDAIEKDDEDWDDDEHDTENIEMDESDARA